MKINEGNVLQDFLSLNPFVVAGLVFLAIALGYIVGAWDFVAHDHHAGRHGITWFWTTTLGDPFIMPATIGMIAWFYQHARVEKGSWLISNWSSLFFLVVGLVVTALFLTDRATLKHMPVGYESTGGDWTTTPDGGLNYYGFFHALFFWGIAFLWAEFTIKGAWYLFKEGFPRSLTIDYALFFVLVLFFLLVLGPKDNKSASPLYNLLAPRGWNF